MEFWAKNLSSPEGPVLTKSNDILLVEMGEDAGCISIVDHNNRKKKQLVKTGRPNGLAIDSEGNIWVAESKTPSLLKINTEGKVTTVMQECAGTPLLFPNDLIFDADGLLYMTDSGILHTDFVHNGSIRPDYKNAEYNGKVFQINTKTNESYLIDDGLLFANGIAIGPKGHLYVNETITGNIYQYEKSNGQYNRQKRSLFANVLLDDGLVYYRGPDGMKFGESGKLYCTVYGQGDVTVLDLEGNVVERIKTLGKCPTNLVFGPKDSHLLFITEVSNGVLECHRVNENGFPLLS
ncbi:SMP-30/gluconolactonase/LRE family protein [uncultured Sphaerochaeta sp.]|uniref:SMP-30/gluconolactonase/LRE family protein n=1 Tax=uncultured Sphaerochaeta sp. TaxID=886478 RepID=UPI002A0A7439|nr:SMP-30/gluconolactonase/LRE family protein [uncultured Sphaerochaeta sp.]